MSELTSELPFPHEVGPDGLIYVHVQLTFRIDRPLTPTEVAQLTGRTAHRGFDFLTDIGVKTCL